MKRSCSRGALIKHAAPPEKRAELIGRIAAGDLRLSFAHGEKQAGFDLNDVGLAARKDGEAYVLDGEKGLVVNGDSADALIVSARIAGGRRDRDGIGLFLVDADAPGVTRRGYTDPGRPSGRRDRLSPKSGSSRRTRSARPEGGSADHRARVDETIAALAAEAVGAMSEALAMTVEYLKTRKQFGVTIGSFQALQHRASDMVVALEQARSMMYLATMSVAEENAEQRAKAISAAKVQIGRSAKFIGQQAVQMHGGIAMTYEYKVGHLFKRLTMIDAAYGDADLHVRRLGDRGSLFA